MQNKDWLKNLPYQKDIDKAKIPFKKQVGLCLLINIIVVVLATLSILVLPPEIPLLYGLPEGEEQIVANWAIVLPNLISFFIMLFNSILANYSKDEYLKKIIIITGFVATFFAIITVLKIFFLVGNI